MTCGILLSHTGDEVPVSGASSMAWSPRSKAYLSARAILDQKLDPKAPPAHEGLYGRRVIATVGPNDNDYSAVLDLEPFRGDTRGLVGFAPVAAENGERSAAPAPWPDAPPAPVPADRPSVPDWPMPAAAAAAPAAEPAPTLKPVAVEPRQNRGALLLSDGSWRFVPVRIGQPEYVAWT
ncbi:MAG: hypothetical protein ACRDGJ_09205, partial [Candidatus Limnocylindria bacterium]